MSKKKTTTKPPFLSPENYIRKNARNLPLYKCFINDDWETNKLCHILIVRKHVTGNVTACLYLVDIACLGVKDTMFRFNVPFGEIEEMMNKSHAPFVNVSYELAHNIIYSAVGFAEDYGFKPHKVFTSITTHFLEEDTDNIPIIEIACGEKDGKPHYINTGFDSRARVQEILTQLEKTAGKGNYYFTVQGHDYFDDDNDNDDDDDDDDNDDDDDDDDDEINGFIAEILRMDKKEQRILFKELIDDFKGENISDENYIKLILITKILSLSLVSKEAVDEQLKIFENKFGNNFVAKEELPNSLFTGVQNMDGKTISQLLTDVFEDIFENENTKEVILSFRNKVGEAPIVDFVELYYLNHRDNKIFIPKLKECHQKYPHYFIFQVYNYVHLIDEKNPEALDIIFLETKNPITKVEASFFFHIYTYSFVDDKKPDLSALIAFEEYLLNLDFLDEETSREILSALSTAKIEKIIEDIEKNGL